MISIDTNVLLRYLLDDDKEQAKKARALIFNSNKVLITDIVLVEMIWTLKGKKYCLDKENITNVIYALFKEPSLCFENGQAVWRAVNDYKNSVPIKSGGKRKEADFPDALIVNKAKYIATKLNTEFLGNYTFDVAALKLTGNKKL